MSLLLSPRLDGTGLLNVTWLRRRGAGVLCFERAVARSPLVLDGRGESPRGPTRVRTAARSLPALCSLKSWHVLRKDSGLVRRARQTCGRGEGRKPSLSAPSSCLFLYVESDEPLQTPASIAVGPIAAI